ncbi:DUF159 family protein [Geomonas limicola]|uniref:Abasic site processing protein n=1 Tax=Geomonas limicola TaxID=2740186 RepID=A0A6V8N3Q4_9BACT|nr:SOS response-associated peptidase [Geomonas limicola]GFO67146.1 DUF159 family protein [Geomonas limicola]
MCGRFTLFLPPGLLAELFGVVEPGCVPDRYNIAPTQLVTVIRQVEPGVNRLDQLHWGLIPPWAKDPSIGSRMINARGETLEEKPAFRNAFRFRRCLIPASGFYEWNNQGGRKVSEFLRLKDQAPLVFAGLWESWTAPQGEVVESCAIVTTAANAYVARLHERMPVLLKPADGELWLDRTVTDPARLKPLLRPCGAEEMEGWTVSPLANSPRNDGVELVKQWTIDNGQLTMGNLFEV